MDDLEVKYALFGLTEEARQRLVQLAQFQRTGDDRMHRVVVETVIVQDGNRRVIDREERSG